MEFAFLAAAHTEKPAAGAHTLREAAGPRAGLAAASLSAPRTLTVLCYGLRIQS